MNVDELLALAEELHPQYRWSSWEAENPEAHIMLQGATVPGSEKYEETLHYVLAVTRGTLGEGREVAALTVVDRVAAHLERGL